MSKLTVNVICLCISAATVALQSVHLVNTIKAINQKNKVES